MTHGRQRKSDLDGGHHITVLWLRMVRMFLYIKCADWPQVQSSADKGVDASRVTANCVNWTTGRHPGKDRRGAAHQADDLGLTGERGR